MDKSESVVSSIHILKDLVVISAMLWDQAVLRGDDRIELAELKRAIRKLRTHPEVCPDLKMREMLLKQP